MIELTIKPKNIKRLTKEHYILKLLLLIFILSISSCNYEDAGEGEGLIAGHKSAEDSFTVNIPLSKKFVAGELISFSITHPYKISVTGSPTLPITIGSDSVEASYITGSGTNTLFFQYTVLADQEDTDGISLDGGINLNGGTVKFNNGTSIVDATTSFSSQTLSGVKVDAVKPTLTGVSFSSLSGSTLYINQYAQLVLTFSEAVNIVSNPLVTIDINGVDKSAVYSAGSGSNTLYFRYQVTANDKDTGDDGFDFKTIDQSSGELKDLAGNTIDLTGVTTVASNIHLDGDTPYITNIATPTAGTYNPGDDLDFTISFSESVSISGTPRLPITVGGSTVYANYQSGTGTTEIIFRYTVSTGQVDTDGITLLPSLELNSGSIQDSVPNNATLTFFPPATSNILIDAPIPTVTEITLPADGTYLESEQLLISLTFNTIVNVNGFPRLNAQLDSTAPTESWFEYSAGSGTKTLFFRYVVTTSDQDIDGFTLSSPISLNSGTIQDANLTNADLNITTLAAALDTSNILIDGKDPVITSITLPSNDYYKLNDNLDFIVHFDETVNITSTPDKPRIALDLGSTVYAEYFSGTGTSDITFRYTVKNTDLDLDGIVLNTTSIDLQANGVIEDLRNHNANLDFSSLLPLDLSSVFIDGIIPTISNVTSSANGIYKENDDIIFTATLSENVYISGSPRIPVTIGSTTKYLTLSSGDTTSTLTFSYSITSGEEDTDGISSATAIDLNSGSILDIAGNNLALSFSAPATSGVLVDSIIPIITIDYSPNITSANVGSYSLSGTCTEIGSTVSLQIGTESFSPSCTGSGTYALSSQDVSAVADSPSVAITATQVDSAGNTGNANTTIDKTTATPIITISTSEDITQANLTSYTLSGTCSENGTLVTIDIGGISKSANCTSGSWQISETDVSSLSDGIVAITADHSTATQASTSVNKDTTSPTVTITSIPNISLSNETSYQASGTCSENGTQVSLSIGSLNYTPSCTSGTWSTGIIDVSSLLDSANISVTADHSTATQASITISKNTATPTLSGLSVSASLSTSIDLTWNLNDPGGFTIDDYTLNYRIKGSPTWLEFADGISTNTYASVTSLQANTTYEFRTKVLYDSGSESDWSNTAEGQTQPDDPLFGPNTAMNVGGAVSSTVVALLDTTTITLNGSPLTVLNKGQTYTFTSSQFDIIDADNPIYTSGRRGSGAGTTAANMVWNPSTWAGRNFSLNSTRYNPQVIEVFAVEDTYIEVKQGSTVLDSATLTKGNGTTLTWSVYGSFQLVATGSVLAFHYAAGTSQFVDPKPLLPGSTEIIGFPSTTMSLTANSDSTNFYALHSNSITSSGSLNKTGIATISAEGTTSLYQCESLLISADKNISGASYADSDGNSSGAFLPTNLMKTKYAIPVSSDYAAFASKQAGSIEVRDSADTLITTLTFTRAGGNSNAPYKAYLSNPGAGYRFISTVPMAGWFQPNTSTGAGDQDETILYGTND